VAVKDTQKQLVSDILRDKWNPIGFADDLPRDEYTDYVPKICAILDVALNDDEAISEIASYLTWVRVRMIGLAEESGCANDARAAVIIVEKTK
jgi:hypothetical protein